MKHTALWSNIKIF